MPRPQKCRFVCSMPRENTFIPESEVCCMEKVQMTVDEYETIRLIDYEDLTQEECSQQMNIARTTVQSIYMSARKKIADVIVNGKKLIITGGEYRLCGEKPSDCKRGCMGGCHRQKCNNRLEERE